MSFGITTFRRWRSSVLAAVILGVSLVFSSATSAQVSTLSEGFDNITTLPSAGWFTQNNSVPVGTTGWFQGNSAVFPAQSGAATSYIGANFNNTTGANTISNWLVTPQLALVNGAQFSFWTRTITSNPFPDRLQVRLSTNGASTNVGTGNAGVGDFTTLLIDINPTYTVGNGPVPTNYPETWTQVTLTLSGLPAGGANGRIAFRYFVEDGGPSGDNSNYIGIDTVSYAGAVTPVDAPLDYNGDGRTDYVVVRNTGGGSGGQVTWYINNGTTFNQAAWGISTDFFVSEDFDGDGKDDLTVYRPTATPANSGYYIFQSQTNTFRFVSLGLTGDDPTIVGDYDGDGKADPAVFRGGASAGQPSFWYYVRSNGNPSNAVTYVQWGKNGDFPAPGDYDGDGRNDFVVQRNNGGGLGQWFMLQTTAGVNSGIVYGTSSDLILPGDYDGDGKTDICVARGSGGQIIWHYRRSSDGVSVGPIAWGLSATDFPTQGDYTGDGRTDIAIWRPNADPDQNFFWIRNTVNGALTTSEWGKQGDYPVANFNSH
jgi:hypothetical protein